jgi:mediator of RNA polymerase II transcription subunit 27
LFTSFVACISNANIKMDVENLNAALKAVKALRSSVGHVFETLSHGVRADHGEENKETKFILELQDLFGNVNVHVRLVSCLQL